MIAGKAFSRYARDLVSGLDIEERVRYLGWCGGPRLDAFFDAIDVRCSLPRTNRSDLPRSRPRRVAFGSCARAVDGLAKVLATMRTTAMARV